MILPNREIRENDTAIYKCDEGYKGDLNRTCLANGTWSGQAATCIRYCPRLTDDFRNGVLNQPEGQRLDVGSNASYVCNDGFQVHRGDANRTCLANGRWSGQAGTCKRTCNFRQPRYNSPAPFSGHHT